MPAQTHGQRAGQQPRKVLADGVVLQPFHARHRFGALAEQPLRAGQRDHGTQHRVRNGDALQHADAVLQKRAHRLELVELVQHLAQQAGGRADDADLRRFRPLGFAQRLPDEAFGFAHAPLERQAHACKAAAHQVAVRARAVARGLLQHVLSLGVLTAVHEHPRQHVAAPGQRDRVGVIGDGQQFRLDRLHGIGVVALHGEAATQQRDTVTLRLIDRLRVALHAPQAGAQPVQIAGVHLQVGGHQQQPEAGLHMLVRQTPHQARQPGQRAARQQVLGAGFHQVGGRRQLARLHRMTHRLVDVAVRAEPAPCGAVKRPDGGVAEPGSARLQHLAQQRMQPVPGFLVMRTDLADEQIVTVQAHEARRHAGQRMRLAQQRRAQRRTETIA